MQEWQYAEFQWDGARGGRVAYFSNATPKIEPIGRDEYFQILARLGDDGWEMCGVFYTGALIITYFKRPKT